MYPMIALSAQSQHQSRVAALHLLRIPASSKPSMAFYPRVRSIADPARGPCQPWWRLRFSHTSMKLSLFLQHIRKHQSNSQNAMDANNVTPPQRLAIEPEYIRIKRKVTQIGRLTLYRIVALQQKKRLFENSG